MNQTQSLEHSLLASTTREKEPETYLPSRVVVGDEFIVTIATGKEIRCEFVWTDMEQENADGEVKEGETVKAAGPIVTAQGMELLPVQPSGFMFTSNLHRVGDVRVPWGETSNVPAWALDKLAVENQLSLSQLHDNMILCKYVGPALQITWKAFGWTCFLWMGTPMITFALVVGRNSQGFPEPPVWLLPSLGVAVVGLLYLEHRVRSIMLVPIARWLAQREPLAVLGFSGDFLVWLIFNTTISFAAHVDVITNGIFVARIAASDYESNGVSATWTHVATQGVIGAAGRVPFSAYAMFGWFCMGTQMVYAVFRSVPRKSQVYEYNAQVEEYATLCDPSSEHIKVFPALLDVCRMASLVPLWFNTDFKELNISPECRLQIPDMLGNQMRISIFRVLMYSVMESAYFLNLQASGLGLVKATNVSNGKAGLDVITFVSLIVGCFMGIFNLVREYSKMQKMATSISGVDMHTEFRDHFICKGHDTEAVDDLMHAVRVGDWQDAEVWSRVKTMRAVTHWDQTSLWNTMEEDGTPGEVLMELMVQVRKGMEQQGLVSRYYVAFKFIVLMYLLLVTRAMVQTYGVLTCDSGLYNIGRGCVDFQ